MYRYILIQNTYMFYIHIYVLYKMYIHTTTHLYVMHVHIQLYSYSKHVYIYFFSCVEGMTVTRFRMLANLQYCIYKFVL